MQPREALTCTVSADATLTCAPANSDAAMPKVATNFFIADTLLGSKRGQTRTQCIAIWSDPSGILSPVDDTTRSQLEVISDIAPMQVWQILLSRRDEDDRTMKGSQIQARLPEGSGGVAWALRELERVGLIERAGPEGRSVVSQQWQATDTPLHWDDDNEQDRLLVRMVERSVQTWREWVTRSWLQEKHSPEGARWLDSEISRDSRLRLSPAQLREMDLEIKALIDRWKQALPESDAQEVVIFVQAHPDQVNHS